MLIKCFSKCADLFSPLSFFTIFPCLYFLFYRLEIKFFSLPFSFGNVKYERRIHEEPLYLPELFAMHVAVSILSPVNIQTRTPALRRSSRDSRTLNWSLETRIINKLQKLQFNPLLIVRQRNRKILGRTFQIYTI